MNLRARLLTAVVVSCVVAAALGFYVVMQESAEAARSRLLLDVLLLASLSGAVFVITRTPLERREELLDAMRALARGVREHRLEPERFGELQDVARSYNEVAAALGEHEDPNLGPVRTRRRQTRPAWMDPEGSSYPELGEVRVISRKPKAATEEPAPSSTARESEPPAEVLREPEEEAAHASAAEDLAARESVANESEVRERPRRRSSRRKSTRPTEAVTDEASHEAAALEKGASDEGAAEELESPERASALPDERRDASSDEGQAEATEENDTTIDDLLARSSSATEAASGEQEASGASSIAVASFDMRALFREFVEAKRAHDEDTDDLEFEAFAETLEEEMDRLVSAHGCRAVRFEVRVQDGEVSLLPRLLR